MSILSIFFIYYKMFNHIASTYKLIYLLLVIYYIFKRSRYRYFNIEEFNLKTILNYYLGLISWRRR